jgi:hypothetical protein
VLEQTASEPAPEAAPEPAPAAEAPPASAWGATADHEVTSVMPAWQQPDPAPPAPASATPGTPGTPASVEGAGVGDTLIMGQPLGVPAGEGGETGNAELRIEGGPDTGHTFRVGDNPLRIGRSPDNDLILRDPATSGHHARLERRGNQWFVVDLGSTNGTLVNGEPIQERELKHKDEIKIGQNTVAFTIL